MFWQPWRAWRSWSLRGFRRVRLSTECGGSSPRHRGGHRERGVSGGCAESGLSAECGGRPRGTVEGIERVESQGLRGVRTERRVRRPSSRHRGGHRARGVSGACAVSGCAQSAAAVLEAPWRASSVWSLRGCAESGLSTECGGSSPRHRGGHRERGVSGACAVSGCAQSAAAVLEAPWRASSAWSLRGCAESGLSAECGGRPRGTGEGIERVDLGPRECQKLCV